MFGVCSAFTKKNRHQQQRLALNDFIYIDLYIIKKRSGQAA